MNAIASPPPIVARPKRKGFDPLLLARILLGIFRRRWLPMILAAICAVIIGVLASAPLTEHVWRATGLLLYAKPPIPDDMHQLADAMDLANVAGFVKSRDVLEQVCTDLALDVPVPLLEKVIKFEQARNQSTIFLSLEWGEEKEATAILDQVMKVYPAYVARVRQEIAGVRQRETEKQLEGIKTRQLAVRSKQQDILRKNGVINFKQDLTLFQTEVMSLEHELAVCKRDEQSLQEQLKMLDKQLGQLREEQAAEEEHAKKFEAAEESLADNRRRQDRLRELIQDERLLLEVTAQLQVKRNEYERAKKLADQRLIPDSQLEQVRGELDSLIARITENKSIAKWKEELQSIDKLVVPTNKVRKSGSPIIHQILFKKLEVELDVMHGRRAQDEIAVDLKKRYAQIATFQTLRAELDGIDSEIEAIAAEYVAMELVRATLQQLATLGPVEFVTVASASAGGFPLSSNRKKVIIGISLAIIALSHTMVMAYDVLRCGLVPSDAQISRLGLPVLGVLFNPTLSRRGETAKATRAATTAAPNSATPESALEVTPEPSLAAANDLTHDSPPRSLWAAPAGEETRPKPEATPSQPDPEPLHAATRQAALTLRQHLPGPGRVLLFSALTPEANGPEVIRRLAECWSARDERVLIVDCRRAEGDLQAWLPLLDANASLAREPAPPADGEPVVDDPLDARCPLPGLIEYLSFHCDSLAEVIYPSRLAGVDIVLPGLAPWGEELATLRMSEVIAHGRGQYSLVALLGPQAASETDLQLLAARADGIVFLFRDGQRVDVPSRKSVAVLFELQAPLLGSIQI